jgi:hypothetical protein
MDARGEIGWTPFLNEVICIITIDKSDIPEYYLKPM